MINRPPATPPSRVQPVKTCYDATLLDDMTTVLVECSTEKVRLRANDYDLFKRHRERIEENFVQDHPRVHLQSGRRPFIVSQASLPESVRRCRSSAGPAIPSAG